MQRVMTSCDRFLTKHFTRPSITWRESFAIILPLIAENVVAQMTTLINSAMISASGVTSLAAVTLVDTLNAFLNVFYLGISVGASIVVANYRGMGDMKKLHESCVQAVTAVTLFTTGTALLIILFHKQILLLLFGQAEQEVMEKATLYLLGGAITFPVIGVTAATCGVWRGIGEGKNSLFFSICSAVTYMLTNIIFLNILDLGITGLVLSLGVSRLMNLLTVKLIKKLTHSTFRFKMKELLHIDKGVFGSILKMGMPVAIENMFFQGGRLVTSVIIVPMGTNATVIYNVGYAIMQLTQTFVGAVSTALYTIVGICFGAKRKQDVKDLTKTYFWVNTVLYALMLVFFPLYFNPLVSLYHPTQEIIHDIWICAFTTTLAQPIIHNLAFMLAYVFRAAGDGNYCTIASLIIMWGVRIFGSLVIGRWMGFGVIGVWSALLIDWVVRAVVYPLHYKKGKWLTHKVIE